MDTAAPMPCAKRFGGPGTSRVFPSRGVRTLTDSWASGEIRGPNRTRSQNPAAMTARPQPKPVSSVTADSSTTRAAVMRAAYSLTGFGKAKTVRQSIPLRAGAGAGAGVREGAEVGLLIVQG